MLRITTLVDNVVRHPFCWGEHGLSFLVETDRGRALLDTGASGTVLLHNVRDALKLRLDPLDALVLSHGHYDHTGGLDSALSAVPGVRVVAHPLVFEPRYAKADDRLHEVGCRIPRAQVESRSPLTLSAGPLEVIPGVWTTGAISERPFPDSGSPRHLVRRGGELVQDLYEDDLSMVVRDRGELVVVVGCCHAGLLNTLRHVARTFSAPIRAIIGGTHLGSAKDQQLDPIVARLTDEYGAPRLFLNHCTTPEIVFRLAQRLGAEKARYLAVGETTEP